MGVVLLELNADRGDPFARRTNAEDSFARIEAIVHEELVLLERLLAAV